MRSFIREIENIHDVESAKNILFKNIEISNEIILAVEFAIEAHQNQKRKSGEPYVIHPILVASLVAKISNDVSMVISALLHDVVEDTEFHDSDILERFGEDVRFLVDGLTKIDSIREKELVSSESGKSLNKSAFSFRKMLTASIQDMRILIIKLCDRIHNLTTLEALSEQKQLRIAEESIVVYAPIAHRLGISSLKSLIEDYSFKYLFKDDYKNISSYLDEYENTMITKLSNFQDYVNNLLLRNGFNDSEFEIHGRIKHKYSIFRKMQRKGINIDEVLDLLAIRVIAKETIDVYKILGLIHLNFKPLAFRFKDYIALPKENGYQTLHTTIIYNNSIFEVQIRTFEMDKTAEYGLAAHWKYKLNNKINTDWIIKLDRKEAEIGDYCDFVRGDLFTEEVTVYSPKYETFTLPRGSVALDFAYAIHSDLGNRAKFAYVNKKKAPLLTELKSGDIVRIVADNKTIHRCSWIDSVKSQHSKKEMRNICNQRIKELNIQTGFYILKTILGISRENIEKFLIKHTLIDNISKISENETNLKLVLNEYIKNFVKPQKLLPIFQLQLQKNRYKLKNFKFKPVKILSNKNITGVHFDVCCHPHNGDEIIGVLRESGVFIHHKLCSQIDSIIQNPENNLEMVYIEWDIEDSYKYNLIVSLSNHRGALGEFLLYLSKLNIDILSIKTEKDTLSSDYTFYFDLEIESKEKNIDKIKRELELKTKIIQLTSRSDSYKR